jgi:uncharacterized protein
MNKSVMQKTFLCVTLFLLSSWLVAQDIPKRPVPPRLVNDYTGILSKSEINKLERKLVSFNDTTSNQIVIVLISSFNGMDKAEFADRIGEKWGVGQKDFDNGVVVLIKPKTLRSKGEVCIATGYGLEGAIPDAITKRIVEYEMIPSFKQNDYYTGLDKGTNVLMDLASGEFSAKEYASKTGSSRIGYFLPFIFILIFYFLIMRSSRRSRSVGKSLPFWTALWLGSTIGNSRTHSGSWSNFSSGGGGFGGGGFGGGGAGGSW